MPRSLGSTARSNPIENAVSSATRLASLSVAARTAVVGPRVRKAARTGFVSGRPVPASAPDWTVIVWKVSTAQWLTGTMATAVSSSFQRSSTAVGGSISSAASTDARSIGVEKPMVAAAWSSTSVPTEVRNAAAVSGTISVGGVAVVRVGRTKATTPRPIAAPRPSAAVARMIPGRRRAVAA